jgi:transmembrane sensor
LEDQQTQNLYSRFLTGNSSNDELKKLFVHFGTQDETVLRSMIKRELQIEDETTTVQSTREHLTTLFKSINERIDHKETTKVNKVKFAWLYAAASVAIFLIVASYFTYQNFKPVNIITAYADYGKTLQVVLPDKSKVWLNAGTTLEYPEKFTKENRTVSLINGQAYFDVIHLPKPFIVLAKNLKVVVLGTSFEVSSFQKQSQATVKVNSGKVGVISPSKQTVFLLAGQKVIVDQISKEIIKTSVAQENVAVWRNKELVFENEPLLSVLQTLERTYNVSIKVGNNKSLTTERVTTRFKDQSLEDVLSALSFSNHFQYTNAYDKKSVIVN